MRTRDSIARYAREGVGALVLITIVICIGAVFQAGKILEWFNPGEDLKIILPREGLFGLAEGAEVRILGTKAGQVSRIVITPDLEMHADVHLQPGMLDFVREDSEVIIRKKFGVAGDAYLEITRGAGQPLDWEYAVLNASADEIPTQTMGELIVEIRTKVLPMIDDAQQIISGLATITGAIERGEGTVARLFLEDELIEQLQGFITQLSTSMTRIDPIFDELQTTSKDVARLAKSMGEQTKNVPQITQQVQSVLASLDEMLLDLRQTTPELPRLARSVADTTESLPVLMLQTQETVVELEGLIRQLRTSWLLGGGADNQTQPAARISPLEVTP